MIKYAWLVLIAGLLVGCGDDREGPSASSAVNYQCYVPQLSCDIKPLAIGNRWTRFTFTYDSAGNVTDTMILIDHIDADTTVDHETWYLWLPPDLSAPGWWYINRNDGLWSGPSAADSRLIYKCPGSVGDEFQSGLTSTYRIIGLDTMVTVPAGTFMCYHYQRVSPGIHEYHEFVAPGIGWVMTREYDTTAAGDRYLAANGVLVDYQVK